MRLRIALAGLAVLAAAATAAVTLGASSGARSSATAIAVIVRVPGQADVTVGAVSAPPNATGGAQGWASGAAVGIASASTSVQTGPGASPKASASAELTGVSLLDGAVTAQRVRGASSATTSGSEPSGDLAGSVVEGLTVLGGSASPVENGRIELGDFGYLVTLESAVQREGNAYRGFVSALHVRLTREYAGLPAGSEIIVGYAEAAVRGQSQQVEPAPDTGGNDGEQTAKADGKAGSDQQGNGGESRHEPTKAPPGSQAAPPPIVRDPPPNVAPDITGRGFVFPVYGQAGFGDDFAAPRADTIWHHGNDIFAPLGTPVLAVTDGTLFLVGWNRLGGHRLWLRDDQGNEYYYAHLSAYSPLAVDGARVQAGDVLGFVGASGASGGVPHLHFEIHPRALLGLGYDGVINPYTYLLAWRAQQDRDFSITIPQEVAPKPGAVLLGAEDLSTASGLDPETVLRRFESPLALPVEEAGLLTPAAPGLIGARPGF